MQATPGGTAWRIQLAPPSRVSQIEAYVSRLLEKLEFNNRVQVALLAHDAGEA